VDAAVADIPDGATIMFGGFGGAGFPNNLIQGLARHGARDLKVISNNCGTADGELGFLFKNRQIRQVVAAFPGPGAKYFHEQFDAGAIELELVPQGILCERMRAFGAGIPAFYSPVGVGTEIAAGKEERIIHGATFSRRRWVRTTLSSKPIAPTGSVIWSIARPPVISIPSWPRLRKPRSWK
jgi:3-oxoacid CoA-transferase A subunit